MYTSTSDVLIYSDNYGSTLYVGWPGKQDIIMEKKVSLLCGIQHSVIMADFLMLETQQPIIQCTCSYYFHYLLSLLFKRSYRTL